MSHSFQGADGRLAPNASCIQMLKVFALLICKSQTEGMCSWVLAIQSLPCAVVLACRLQYIAMAVDLGFTSSAMVTNTPVSF
jgi:hypothetical protein